MIALTHCKFENAMKPYTNQLTSETCAKLIAQSDTKLFTLKGE